MAGAFEDRIALTIPQESGSGGDACWRLSKYEIDNGNQVQDAVEIVGENVWFSPAFNAFSTGVSPTSLCVDTNPTASALVLYVFPSPLISNFCCFFPGVENDRTPARSPWCSSARSLDSSFERFSIPMVAAVGSDLPSASVRASTRMERAAFVATMRAI